MSERWAVFDTETTGLLMPSAAEESTQPRIIEIGIVILESGIVSEEFSCLVNPGESLTPEITKITGLTDDDLKDEKPFATYIPALTELLLGVRGLVAHNLPFDRGMLVSELARCGREFSFPYPPEQICTVLAYHHLKGRNLKLIELYAHIMGRPLKQTHRALDDARALAEILIKEAIA